MRHLVFITIYSWQSGTQGGISFRPAYQTVTYTWCIQVLRSPNLLKKKLLTLGSWKCGHFSTQSPCRRTHFSQRRRHDCMSAANASLGVRCDHWKIAVARTERLENVRPRRVSFSVGNNQKSFGARSGEYGAWGTTSKLLSSKNWWTRAARWGGALSWWKNTATAFWAVFHAMLEETS